MNVDKDYCMSSFLLYRRVVKSDACFSTNRLPNTINPDWGKKPIKDSLELENHLRNRIAEVTKNGKAALALSGGIDSAILAKFMPKGSTAYTFKCVADGKKTTDESKIAALYAKECGLNHKVIEITWDDMKKYAPILMEHKNAPIHSIEVQIYMAGLKAKEDGFDSIIYGETADVNYGGLSNILSKDWEVGDFIERYAYLKPWKVLKKPVINFIDISEYTNQGYIDVHKYLSHFDIIESINSYVNASETAGIGFIAPFADTYLDGDLDLVRIRKGENKYLIREIFNKLYPNFKTPTKIPMPRATDEWLMNWEGPSRYEFIENCVENLSGDQKWMLWSLEKYLNMIDDKDNI